MAKYADFTMGKSGVVRVEIDPSSESAEVVRGGQRSNKDVIEPAKVAFDAALAKLKPICTAIVKQARELAEQPDEFSVEFGVKLNAEAGVVIAKTAAEANFKISVKWKKRETTNPG